MPDVNGSSFHLFLTEADWFTNAGPGGQRPTVSSRDPSDLGSPDLEWTSGCGLRLRRTVLFDRRTGAVRLGNEHRRGCDRDVDGVFWHVGDDRHSLWRTRDGDTEHFWPRPLDSGAERTLFAACRPTDGTPATLGGLAATEDRWLVAGVLDPGSGPLTGPGLLVIDLLAGGAPGWRDWSGLASDFRPIDACRRPGGGLLVLDADPARSDGKTRVWPLDDRANPALLRQPEPFETVFEACDPGSQAVPPEPMVAGTPYAWTLQRTDAGSIAARSIAALDDATYLVLDAVTNRVLRFERENQVGSLDLEGVLATRLDDPNANPTVRGHDIAVATLDGRRVLFVSDASGQEVFTFDIDDHFAVLADRYTMRRHHGRGLVSDGRSVWFDTARRWHPLVARGRSECRRTGTIVTAEVDGRKAGCRWHRIAIDGRIPAGTSLRVETRAADVLTELSSMPWRLEPTPYLRRGGTELPVDIATGPADSHGLGTWETLIQSTDGRYCQLRLTLASEGGSSPEISALRLIYPRFSYLHQYLPQVYAENDAPTRFLERYLANPEGLLTDLEGRIADADLLFDPTSAPAQYLGWLAGWVGVQLDADLDTRRRRLFLRNSARLFAMRGTPAGMVLALRLVLDECPEAAFDEVAADPAFTVRIAERYLSRSSAVPLMGGPTQLGEVAQDLPASRWTAGMGANELHQRFRDDLLARYGSDWSGAATGRVPAWLRDQVPARVEVSPLTPTDPGARDDWTRFLSGQLGVRAPVFGLPNIPLYRRFLLQRYERPERYAAAYQVPAPGNFDDVGPPERLPSFGPALEDWSAFVSLVGPIAAAAHRFTVLIPVAIDAPEREQLQLLDRARRVVEIEKPAHTAYEVRPYWAAFQLGEARLGVDTRLGRGARRSALVLDRSRLAQAGLAPPTQHSNAGSCGCT